MGKQQTKTPETKSKTKTKHRKGGDKVRKLAPGRRLNATLDKFVRSTDAEYEAKAGRLKEQQLNVASFGSSVAMDQHQLSEHLRSNKAKAMSAQKLARLLMPNARF